MPALRSCLGPLHRTARRILARARSLRADTSGAAVVLAAILFPVVIGGFGLGAETGYNYLTQRKLQHAADVSAHAAGARLRAGDTEEEIEAAALAVAAESGVIIAPEPDGTGGTVSMVVNTPPENGPHAGEALMVEVLISRAQPRLFSSVFSDEPVGMGARAVARVSETGSVACVLALSPTASGAVTITGSTSVGLEECDVASNSNAVNSFEMSGSSPKLAANCVYTVGEAVTTGGLTLTGCDSVKEHAPAVRDPYASVSEPAAVGECQGKNQGSPNSTTTLTPSENHPSGVKSMRFCSGLDVKGDVTFGPGLYIIEKGDFTINSGNADSSGTATLTGNDVTFLFTNGARLRLGNNGVLDFSAPAEGPFSGLLFFGSRSETGLTHHINGASGSTTQGATYVPASRINFSGNSKTTNGCTQIIGRQITFSGNSSLRSSCENAGTRDIWTNEAVTLVE